MFPRNDYLAYDVFVLIPCFFSPSCCRLRNSKMHWPSMEQIGAALGWQRAWRNQSYRPSPETKISLSPLQECRFIYPAQMTWLKQFRRAQRLLLLNLQEFPKSPRARHWSELGDEMIMLMLHPLPCTGAFLMAVYTCIRPSIGRSLESADVI